MKKLHLMAWPKLCSALFLGAAALFMASCAKDGYDNDEKWESAVRNSAVHNPTKEDISVTPTVDRKQTNIEWKVVQGAAKYDCKLYDVTDGKREVLLDSIVDGISVLVPRVRNTYYLFTIRTIPDTSLGNWNEDEGATPKDFDSKLEIYATIDGGADAASAVDLNAYFEKNPVPVESELSEIVYNMQAGKYYKVTKELKFGDSPGKPIMLRCEDESQRSYLTMGDDATGFIVPNSFTLEGLDITCGASTKPLITLNDAPHASLIPTDVTQSTTYYRINNIDVTNCHIKGLKGSLVYDSQKQYCVVGLNITNTILQLANDAADNVKNESLISMYGGGVKEFTIANSTVYQTGTSNPKYFLRYSNSARIDRFGYNTSDSKYTPEKTKITYTNNTFYKVGSGNWSNYTQLENGTIYEIKKNIWVECGNGQIARRILGNGRSSEHSAEVWDLNTYVTDGAINPQQDGSGNPYDKGTQLQTLPGFADPDNGDFTISGGDQLTNKTGDPRWIK